MTEKKLNRDQLIQKIVELEAVKKELKGRKLTEDLFEFNKQILQVEGGKNNVPLSSFHHELCDFVMDKEKNKKLILVPRGHLKSTLVTVGYSLLRIAQDPSVRILLANATYDMATSFLGQIKKHIKENDVFRDYYGDYGTNPDKWAENMISIGKKRTFGRKEATVTTFGIGGNLVSQHYDVIIMDDVVNRDLINTAEQIQKTVLFYKDALDLLEPNGVLIIIGTRWSDNDLYGWIMDQSNPEQVWRNFAVMVRQAYQGNLETEEHLSILYPEKFTRDILKTLKMEKGPYEFSCTPEETPILMSDWSLKKISNVEVGDEVVGFMLKDGEKRKLVKSKIKRIFKKKDQVYSLKMSSGRNVLCTKDHKWMTRKSEDKTHSLYNVPKVGRRLRYITDTSQSFSSEEVSDYRYIAGMIDGDGGCKSGNSIFIHQCKKANPVVWKEIRNVLDRLKLPYTSKDNYLWLNGGTEVREKILRVSKPAKSYQVLDSMYGSRFCREKDEIVSMEKEEVRDVYALETETGNYVAWGYASSNSQYMNDPVPQEDAKFKTEWMKHILEDELRIRDINYFTMVDPAIGQLKTSDKTAIVTVGVDQWNNWFVVNIILGKMLPSEIIDNIFYNWEHYHPRKIGIEMTAYQKSLQYAIIDEMRRRNVFLPVVELKANRSKDERIEGLVPRYANGSIYHLQQCPFRDQLEEELMRFPKGKHDDIIDALAYGMQICYPTRGKKPQFREPEDRPTVKYLY